MYGYIMMLLLVLWSGCSLVYSSTKPMKVSHCKDEEQQTISLVLRNRRNRTGVWSTEAHLEHNRYDVEQDDAVQVSMEQNTAGEEMNRVSVVASIAAPLATAGTQKAALPIIQYVVVPGVGTYSLHTEIVTWKDAKHTCEREQAHLVIVNSESEAQALMDMFKRYPHIQDIDYLNEQAHMGVSDLGTEGQFITIFGDRLENTGYLKWAKNEPNSNGGDEDCVTFRRDGHFNDVPCDTGLPFFCERSEPNASSKAPGTLH